MTLERQSPPEIVLVDGVERICCDICGPAALATMTNRPTRNREQAFYCDDCTRRFSGWPEKMTPIGEVEL